MAKATVQPVSLWFIGYSSIRGHGWLYAGCGFATRKAAIRDHERAIGQPWKDLKRGGDFAVKCLVTPVEMPR